MNHRILTGAQTHWSWWLSMEDSAMLISKHTSVTLYGHTSYFTSSTLLHICWASLPLPLHFFHTLHLFLCIWPCVSVCANIQVRVCMRAHTYVRTFRHAECKHNYRILQSSLPEIPSQTSGAKAGLSPTPPPTVLSVRSDALPACQPQRRELINTTPGFRTEAMGFLIRFSGLYKHGRLTKLQRPGSLRLSICS